MTKVQTRKVIWLIPTLLLLLIAALMAFSIGQPNVSASSPPPEAPQFEGDPTTFIVNSPEVANAPTVAVNAPQSDWQIIFESNFEGVNWELDWTNLSLNGSPYKFGTETLANPLDPASTRVAWAVGQTVGGGAQLVPGVDGYPPNVDSVIIAGPFDFSDVIASQLSFQYSFEANMSTLFTAAVSTDGSQFVGLQTSGGGDGSWSEVNYNLNAYAGESQVWFAFSFKSDAADSGAQPGLFIDNVALRVQYTNKTLMPYVAYGFTPTPIPTPTVTPTPTRPPNQDYFAEFTNTISPWEARRWTNGAAWELIHRSDCDGGRCGFLQLRDATRGTYVLVSPLVQSRRTPYNVQTVALFKDPQAGHSYSVIFGANWNGQQCPQPDFSSCFNTYYEMRVEYVDASDDYLRMKLKRIDGHDQNNQNFGPDLIEWTRVRDINPRGWVKWDVTVREDGSISVGADKKLVGSAKDATYLGQPFFGLMVRNADLADGRVKFDRFQVDWPDALANPSLEEIWAED